MLEFAPAYNVFDAQAITGTAVYTSAATDVSRRDQVDVTVKTTESIATLSGTLRVFYAPKRVIDGNLAGDVPVEYTGLTGSETGVVISNGELTITGARTFNFQLVNPRGGRLYFTWTNATGTGTLTLIVTAKG